MQELSSYRYDSTQRKSLTPSSTTKQKRPESTDMDGLQSQGKPFYAKGEVLAVRNEDGKQFVFCLLQQIMHSSNTQVSHCQNDCTCVAAYIVRFVVYDIGFKIVCRKISKTF